MFYTPSGKFGKSPILLNMQSGSTRREQFYTPSGTHGNQWHIMGASNTLYIQEKKMYSPVPWDVDEEDLYTIGSDWTIGRTMADETGRHKGGLVDKEASSLAAGGEPTDQHSKEKVVRVRPQLAFPGEPADQDAEAA